MCSKIKMVFVVVTFISDQVQKLLVIFSCAIILQGRINGWSCWVLFNLKNLMKIEEGMLREGCRSN